MVNFEIFFDGACAPNNPGGHLGYGYIIYIDGEYLFSDSFYEPENFNNTNNVAEYKALIEAIFKLQDYVELNNIGEYYVFVCGDSKLVINQMKGSWNINNGNYKSFAILAKRLIEKIPNIEFKWIPRELNTEADEMSKQELLKIGIR